MQIRNWGALLIVQAPKATVPCCVNALGSASPCPHHPGQNHHRAVRTGVSAIPLQQQFLGTGPQAQSQNMARLPCSHTSASSATRSHQQAASKRCGLPAPPPPIANACPRSPAATRNHQPGQSHPL